MGSIMVCLQYILAQTESCHQSVLCDSLQKKSETIFYLFLSILHYLREYLLKIGENSGMKHRLALPDLTHTGCVYLT